MGRKGNALPGVDDWEMAMSACDLGLGMGKFPELSLTHLIPKERIQLDYLLALQENASRAYQLYVSSRPELSGLRYYGENMIMKLNNLFNRINFLTIKNKFKKAYLKGVNNPALR
jgi:hypothetical protein